jgi:hypothetical protein
MRSEEDKAGFELLNSWKAQSEFIRFSFVGIGRKLDFSGRCLIIVADDEGLRLEGAGFTVFVDMKGAAFERVASKELFKELGLDSSAYAESVEIILDSGDTVTLFATPAAASKAALPN